MKWKGGFSIIIECHRKLKCVSVYGKLLQHRGGAHVKKWPYKKYRRNISLRMKSLRRISWFFFLLVVVFWHTFNEFILFSLWKYECCQNNVLMFLNLFWSLLLLKRLFILLSSLRQVEQQTCLLGAVLLLW